MTLLLLLLLPLLHTSSSHRLLTAAICYLLQVSFVPVEHRHPSSLHPRSSSFVDKCASLAATLPSYYILCYRRTTFHPHHLLLKTRYVRHLYFFHFAIDVNACGAVFPPLQKQEDEIIYIIDDTYLPSLCSFNSPTNSQIIIIIYRSFVGKRKVYRNNIYKSDTRLGC